MQNNLAIAVQNFVKKFSKVNGVDIVEFLLLKITISSIVREKRKPDDCDYLGQIASEIQTKFYRNNVIFIANICANQRKNMTTVYTRHTMKVLVNFRPILSYYHEGAMITCNMP